MTRWCLYPGCTVLIVGYVGAAPNRCAEHATAKVRKESDEERIGRVCELLGWRRRK